MFGAPFVPAEDPVGDHGSQYHRGIIYPEGWPDNCRHFCYQDNILYLTFVTFINTYLYINAS